MGVQSPSVNVGNVNGRLPTVCRFGVRFARVLPLVFVGNGFDVGLSRTGEK